MSKKVFSFPFSVLSYFLLATLYLLLTVGNLWAAKTCVNTYCHGNFAGSGYSINVATWNAPVTGECGTCHGAGRYGVYDTIKSSAPKGGSHYVHTSTTSYNYLCKLCHDATVTNWGESTTTIRLSTGTHIRGQATDIKFSTHNLTRPQLALGISSPTYADINAYDGVYSTSPPNTPYAKCENLYCHGAINTAYVARRSTPTWGDSTTGDCGTCHDAGRYDVSVATAPAGWEHYTHASSANVTGVYSYECRYCHEGTVNWAGLIAYPTAHVQGYVDVRFSTSSLTKGSGGTAGLYRGMTYSVDVATNPPYNDRWCSNIYCHSDSSGPGKAAITYRTVYSTNTMSCNSCHDSYRGTPSSTTLSTAHYIHIDTGTSRYGYKCYRCHNQTAQTESYTIRYTTNHVSGNKTVAFSTHNLNATYTAGTTRQCQNAYCHGRITDQYITTMATPTWNSGGSANCGSCHGSGQYSIANSSQPPAGWKHSKHVSTNTYNYSCRYCHEAVVNWSGQIIAVSSHVQNLVDIKFSTSTLTTNATYWAMGTPYPDSSYYVGAPTSATNGDYWNRACANLYCHSNANPSGTGAQNKYVKVYSTDTVTCTSCHQGPGTGGGTNLSMSHSTHTTSLKYGYTCERCHYNTVNGTSTIKTTGYDDHVNGTKTIVFNPNWSGPNGTGNYDAARCSNVYCHGNFNGSGYTTNVATWNIVGTADCGTCHAVGKNYTGNYTVAKATSPSGGSHSAHTSTTTYNYQCEYCHKITAGSTGVIIGYSTHTNYATNISLSTNTTIISGSARYANTISSSISPPRSSYPSTAQCKNLYCHSDGKSSGIVYSTPSWGGTIAGDCIGCHKGSRYQVNASSTISTGKHTAHHLDTSTTSATIGINYRCKTCHNLTIANFTSDIVISSYTIHISSTRNVNFSTVTWPTGSPSAGNWDSASSSCTNVYCHSNGVPGSATDYKVVKWNIGNIQCYDCHGSTTTSEPAPSYTGAGAGVVYTSYTNLQANSHGSHSNDCNYCHYRTAISSTALKAGTTIHTDGGWNEKADVYFDTTSLSAPTASYTRYGADGKSTSTADNMTCANTGDSCHNVGTPQWGGTVSCLDCHADLNDLDDYTPNNKRVAKISTDTYTGWYGSKHYQYNVTCTTTNCHDSNSNHYDSNNPFRLKYATYTYTYELGCTTGTCHQNIKRHSLATTSGDSWNQVANSTDNYKCVDCHDPHRDRNVFVSTAVSKSVQSLVARNTSDERGKPYYTGLSTTPVNFVLSVPTAKATDYIYIVGTDTSTRICQTCHQSNNNYTLYWTSATAHYGSGDKCTSCHAHSNAFAASCIICHGAPPVDTIAVPGNDTHRKHYDWAASTPTLYGQTVNLSSGQIYIYGCGICHDSGDHGAQSTPSTFTVQVVFDTVTFPMNVKSTYTYANKPWSTHTYSASGQGYRYNNSGECRNNYCHGQFVSSTTSNNTIGISSTPVWGGAMPLDAGTKCGTACHNISTNTKSGLTHSLHVSSYNYRFTCDWCHYDTASSTYSIRLSSYHVNGKVDWDFDATKSTWIYTFSKYREQIEGSTTTFGVYTSSCTNLYCHSNGRPITDTAGEPISYSSATWETNLDCAGCHGGSIYANATSTMSTRRHKSHINNAGIIGTNYRCAECHQATLDTSSDTVIPNQTHLTQHVNGVRKVSFTVTGDWVEVSSRCENLYCHGDGKGTTYTVKWDTYTTDGCDLCHGTSTVTGGLGYPDYLNAGAGSTRSNNHGDHVDSVDDCQKCHYQTVTNGGAITGSGKHTDQKIHISTGVGDYSFKYSTTYPVGATAVGLIDYALSASTKTCTNISCHGGGTARWGATLTCLDCHADLNDLDDYTPNNNRIAKISTDAYTGWYGSKHYQYNVTCTTTNCHDSNSNHYDSNNPFRLKYATYTYTYELGCTTGTCHQNIKRHSLATTGGNSWNQVATATDNYKCVDCHDPHKDKNVFVSTAVAKLVQALVARKSSSNRGIPDFGGFLSTAPVNFVLSLPPKATDYVYSLDAGTDTKICQTCHQYNKYYTISWGSASVHYGPSGGDTRCTNCHAHSNAFAASCIICHGAPPVDTATPANDTHRKHYDWAASTPTLYGQTVNLSSGQIYIYGCGICHKSNDHGATVDKGTFTVEVVFDTITFPMNAYSTYNYTGTTYWSTHSYSASGQGYKYNNNAQCQNNYCHGYFKTGTNNTIGISSRPVWGGAMPLDAGTKCGTACHNISTVTTSGKSHRIHVSSQGYSCDFCHYDTASSTYAVRYSSYHVNGGMNIRLYENATPRRIFSTSTYAGANIYSTGTFGNYAVKFCSNVYCHSTVQGSSITTVTNQPAYRSVSWSSGTLNCNDCHTTSSATVTTANFTGSHYAHIKSTFAYTCDRCHPYTNPRLSPNLTTLRQHSNKWIEVSTGNYVASHSSAPQTANYGTCSNVSCHGQDVNFQWGTEIGTDCAKCHLTTGDDVDDYGFNNGIMARISSSSTYGWYGSSHYAQGYPCANDNCHTTDIHTSTNPFRLKNVVYSTTTELGCLSGGSCHSVSNYVRHSSYTTTGDATKNWGQPSNAAINYKCVDCHDPHKDRNFFQPTLAVSKGIQYRIARSSSDDYGRPYYTGLGTAPVNFTLGLSIKATDYVFSVDAGTTTKICQTCHQSNKFYTISWGSASVHYGSGGSCKSCHPHNKGFSAGGCYSGSPNCHGDGVAVYFPTGTATSGPGFNRAGEHYDHMLAISKYNTDVDTYTEKQKEGCKFCHTDDPGGGSGHNSNGSADFITTMKNILKQDDTGVIAQYVDASSACTNSDCHAQTQTPNWYGVVTASCGVCHKGTNLNPKTNAHNAHVSTYGYVCTECHPKYEGTASSYSHTNGVVDMQWTIGSTQTITTAFYDKFRKTVSTTGFSPSWDIATSTFGPCWNVYCHRPSTQTFIYWNQTWISTGQAGFARCDQCHDLPPKFSATIKSSFTHYGDHTMGSTGTVNASTQVFNVGQSAGDEIGGYNFGCKKCHPDPTVSISSHARGMAVRNSSMTANITFDNTTDPMNQNAVSAIGSFVRQDNRGYWFTNTRCSSTYCHGATKLPSGMRSGASISTPVWSSNLATAGDSACGACHNTTDAQAGSHQKHVTPGTYGYGCDFCHVDSATGTYTVKRTSYHVDGKASWNFDDTNVRITTTPTRVPTYKGVNAGSTGTFANYGYQLAGSSCTNLYCHSQGKRSYSVALSTPWWGGSLQPVTSTCTWCHGGVANYTVLTSSHFMHVSTNTVKTATIAGRQYAYTCETCHRYTVSGSTTIKSGGYTLHVSSIANVSFSSWSAVGLGWNRTFPRNQEGLFTVFVTSGSCTKVYCHSYGTAVKTGSLGNSATPYWWR